jgi:hypothetical protein
MLLAADHQDYILDDGVVELLLRRGVDRLRKVHACDNGADVLLNPLNFHGLRGNPCRDIVHDLPLISYPADWLGAGNVPELALGDTIGRMVVSIKTAMAITRQALSAYSGRTAEIICRPP